MEVLKTVDYEKRQERVLTLLQERANLLTGEDYKIDETNRDAVDTILKYICLNPEFEKIKSGYSFAKGLMLFGPAGTGKTLLMKCLQCNPRRSFVVRSCRKISHEFALRGRIVIDENSKFVSSTTNHHWRDNPGKTVFGEQIPKPLGITFDDLGSENIGHHFQDAAEVLEQIILSIYEAPKNDWNSFDGYSITTNLTASLIEARYGTRVRSRIREMFNLIEVPGSDRRK